MKLSMYLFGAVVLFLFTDAATTVTDKRVLSYKIVDDAANKKLKLTLSGADYASATKHCLMKKPNPTLTEYEDINTCTHSDTANGAQKCVIPCDTADNKLAYNILSPRSKYIYVFIGNDATAAVATVTSDKKTEVTIFGFQTPLLVNPQVAISLDTTGQKLKFATKTCDPVACPVKYKKVQYAAGEKTGTACVTAVDNVVDFDLMIPYYEMQCENYPSFFYKMPNAYMKKEIDVFKPQYYAAYKSADDKTKYKLNFTNKFPSEICRFGIRDGTTATPTGTFTSVCGGEGKECYAPCDNVELTLTETKPVVQISIQTRHHDIKVEATTNIGFREKKFAIIEPDGGLLKAIIGTGVTLNPLPFKVGDATNKFTECNVKHFAADKPRRTARTGTASSCGSSVCDKLCGSDLTIIGMTEGKPMMIEVTPKDSDHPVSYSEYLFVMTKPKENTEFIATAPTVTETTAVVKALTGDDATAVNEPTCSYYISLAGKNAFTEAQCSDSYPCRGHCKESKTIINLIPGSTYDIKVIGHKEYTPKTYSGIQTSLATLTLTSSFLDKGFKVAGTLSSPDPEALCNIKLQKKVDQTFQEIFVCPPAPSAQPASGNANTPAGGSTGSANGGAPSTSQIIKLSKFNGLKVARAGTPANDGQTPSTQSTPTTTVQFTPCTQPPLCAHIIVGEGYEADKEYKMLVTAIGRSAEVPIDIPKNPSLAPVETTNKPVTVLITRDGTTLTVNAVLPEGVDENSYCKWELRNWEHPAKPIVRKCMVLGSEGCAAFPLCKEITISGIEDSNDYHMKVIHVTDGTVSGTGELKKGASSNKSTIVAALVPAVLVVAGIGFYFGYWRNRS